MPDHGHTPRFERYEAIVGMRHHGGRITPIRRMRYWLECSTCDATLGMALDYIDARRRWKKHTGAERIGSIFDA